MLRESHKGASVLRNLIKKKKLLGWFHATRESQGRISAS